MGDQFHFHLAALITCFASFINAVIVAIFSFQQRIDAVKKQYLLYSSALALWSLCVYLFSSTPHSQLSFFYLKVLHIGAILIPVFWFHFNLIFFNQLNVWNKAELRIYYFFSFIFLFCNFFLSNLFIGKVYPQNGFPNFMDPGPLYLPWVLLFFIIAVSAHIKMYKYYFILQGLKKRQLTFFVIASLIGYIGALGYFLPLYDQFYFPYPYGCYGAAAFAIVAAVSIVRYRLFDIELIIKKTLVFTGVFAVLIAVVAGVTAITQSYIGQYIGMNALATRIISLIIAMFLFDPLRKFLVNITDKYLFQKKYDYHRFLKDASRGMSKIEGLHRMLGLVVHFITMKMRVNNAAVLRMKTGDNNSFALAYKRGYGERYFSYELSENSPLVKYLYIHKEAVDIEKIKEKIENIGSRKKVKLREKSKRKRNDEVYDYEGIKKDMDGIKASCCVPSFLGRELKNILMLGEKKSGGYYTDEDSSLLFALAQEASIAIENARLYDEAINKTRELGQINEQLGRSKKLLEQALTDAEGANKQLQDTQAQLIHEQKMATLGRLAASVGHEVNNPLTILSMNVSRIILKYRKDKSIKVSEIIDVFDKMEKNIERIKAVVNTLTGLLKKSEKGRFEPLSLKLLLEETLPLVQFQTYLDNLSGTEVDFNVPGNIPLIRGDLERLQEVFLNLFITAYHAMAGKRHRKIKVVGEIDPEDSKMVAVHFTDNGSGMAEETRKKIFNYGFTTKPVGKGSGLGLYMCKYIIELHGGTIRVKSKQGEGTTFTLTLPAHEDLTKTNQITVGMPKGDNPKG